MQQLHRQMEESLFGESMVHACAHRCGSCGGAASTAFHLSQGHMNSKLLRWYASQSARRARSSGSSTGMRAKHSRTHALMLRGKVAISLHTSTCAHMRAPARVMTLLGFSAAVGQHKRLQLH